MTAHQDDLAVAGEAETIAAAAAAYPAGRTYISPAMTDSILSTRGGRPRGGADVPVLSRLSDRERQVLHLVGCGLAESHLAHLKRTLGLRNGRELTCYAVTWVEGQAPGART